MIFLSNIKYDKKTGKIKYPKDIDYDMVSVISQYCNITDTYNLTLKKKGINEEKRKK